MSMGLDQFRQLIGQVTATVAGKPLDQALEQQLNERFPFNGPDVRQLVAACEQAIADGWNSPEETANDPDLAPIRDEPEFTRLIAEMREKSKKNG